MAKIPLTIDPKYCSGWGFWEGVRELVQNAKDADEFEGHKMTVKHHPQSDKLVISNEGVALPASLLLLLGATSKEDGSQRGRFGEGFVVGTLALVRAGHAVTIYNGDEVWRPGIELPDAGHAFEGTELFVMSTRKLQKPREDFTVEVENVTKDIWQASKKLFLFLDPPKANETVEVWRAKVLLSDDYRGMVFSRGIFVTRHEEIDYGYDLPDLQLDRDRRSVDDWNLKYRLGEAWNEAYKKYPEKFATHIYQMAKDDKAEVRSLHYNADQKLIAEMRKQFQEEYGEEVVPVSSIEDSRELEDLGAKTVVVNKTLQQLLEKGSPTKEDIKTKLRGSLKHTYSWGELTPAEQAVCTGWIDKVISNYIIVDFNDTLVPVRAVNEQVGIARWALAGAVQQLLVTVAREAARLKKTTPEDLLVDALCRDAASPEAEPDLAIPA